MNRGLKRVFMAVVVGTFLLGCAPPAQRFRSNEEIETQVRELERKKQQEQAKRDAKRDANRPTVADIGKYERQLDGCAVKRNDRCADVMFTLGSLYYDQARERFDNETKEYKRTGRGTQPVPDYSKSLMMYWQLSREYPSFPKLPEAYYQMSRCYIMAGHLDTASVILEQLATRFPNSPRASAVQFYLGELAFMDNNFNKALEYFKKVKKEQVDGLSWELNNYRMGECAYNTGDLDFAVEYFHNYVEACDRNEHKKKEYRDMALEYMAIAFSDMPNGADEAITFFERNKGKPYEAQVVYMVGAKNRDHGQWNKAIPALESALKKYPTHKEAPFARQRLIECYAAKKEHEKADKERESLIKDYGAGSKWYSANSNDKVVMDKVKALIEKAKSELGNSRK